MLYLQHLIGAKIPTGQQGKRTMLCMRSASRFAAAVHVSMRVAKLLSLLQDMSVLCDLYATWYASLPYVSLFRRWDTPNVQ